MTTATTEQTGSLRQDAAAHRRPNFFLVGAPKCGTTSVYTYLGEHPDIYLPNAKEPQFFCTDFPAYREWTTFNSLDRYLALYRKAHSRYTAIGDASTFYLYSKNAIRNAYEFNQSARFIAMVRSPIEMAASLHSHYVYKFREVETSFETAWRLQDRRAKGECLPKWCLAAEHLQYRDVCRLGEQIQRLLNIVPPDQCKVILFDDFKASPQAVYEDVLRFLGVEGDGRTEFPKVNDGRSHRFRLLGRLCMTAPFPFSVIRRAIGPSMRGVLTRSFHRRLARPIDRAPLSPDFRRELIDEFRDDVGLLGELLSRDLSAWMVGSTIDTTG